MDPDKFDSGQVKKETNTDNDRNKALNPDDFDPMKIYNQILEQNPLKHLSHDHFSSGSNGNEAANEPFPSTHTEKNKLPSENADSQKNKTLTQEKNIENQNTNQIQANQTNIKNSFSADSKIRSNLPVSEPKKEPEKQHINQDNLRENSSANSNNQASARKIVYPDATGQQISTQKTSQMKPPANTIAQNKPDMASHVWKNQDVGKNNSDSNQIYPGYKTAPVENKKPVDTSKTVLSSAQNTAMSEKKPFVHPDVTSAISHDKSDQPERLDTSIGRKNESEDENEKNPLSEPQQKEETNKDNGSQDSGDLQISEKLTPVTKTNHHAMMRGEEILEEYSLKVSKIIVNVKISIRESDFVPNYIVSITNISTTTKIILEKIREEFISTVDTSKVETGSSQQRDFIKEKFKTEITELLNKYFPGASDEKKDMLIGYLIEQHLGLGHLEILLADEKLEEIVVNNAKEPVWVYHKKEGWLKTNIILLKENKIRHYSTMIGRDVNKEITLLHPLLDAHLLTGDRVNATLNPISTKGNTITIRKFSKDPWTITKFLKAGTVNYYTAAIIWQLIQNELSIIVAGGTGSGKTSMLNVCANFFPPNHRILSIEDTRELTLPDNLHWVPLETRLPNPEGKGGVSMLDLLVNSLRMRPDRILVGEIRRKEEAQVLLEAMHTGHSVYGTFHANTADEALVRLTHDPINIAKPTLSSLGALLVQNRDRRTGKRRVLQLAEITQEGDPHIVVQYDAVKDTQLKKSLQKRIYETLNIFTGMTPKEVEDDLNKKVEILKWLVRNNVEDINQIGIIMAKYYRGKLFQ